MLDEKRTPKDTIYKSPARKLAQFFEKSRDKWKRKCQQAKYTVKLLRNKVRYLEKRKAELTRRVKELEKELEAHRGKKT